MKMNYLLWVITVSTVGMVNAGSLTEVNHGDVNSERDSGDITIGNYSGNRIAIDNNEIQSQNCAVEPCNPVSLYLQREGGPLYIGYQNTTQVILTNASETEQYIRFKDRQKSTETATVGFDSGAASSGLQITAKDDNNFAWFEFRPNGSAYKLGGGSWSTLSDQRVKSNIGTFSTGLDALAKIEPVTYEFNGLGGTKEDGKKYVGILAQDINKIDELAKYSVTTTKAKLRETDKKESELLTYDSSALLYVAVNAIKELKAKVETLETQTGQLQAENVQLRAIINGKLALARAN